MGSIRINFKKALGRGQDEEKYEKVTDDVTTTLMKICGKDCIVDWRDWREVEIHNVDNVAKVVEILKIAISSNINWMVSCIEDISSIRGVHPTD